MRFFFFFFFFFFCFFCFLFLKKKNLLVQRIARVPRRQVCSASGKGPPARPDRGCRRAECCEMPIRETGFSIPGRRHRCRFPDRSESPGCRIWRRSWRISEWLWPPLHGPNGPASKSRWTSPDCMLIETGLRKVSGGGGARGISHDHRPPADPPRGLIQQVALVVSDVFASQHHRAGRQGGWRKPWRGPKR